VPPRVLAQRNLLKNAALDYWESGMDIRRKGDMFECFIRYQLQIQKHFRAMQASYGFHTINGNRSAQMIAQVLRTKVDAVLQPAGAGSGLAEGARG